MANKIIEEAIKVLKDGGVILIPTETVYGIAADATNPEAVEKIYKIKNRPREKALQLLVPNLESARKYADLSGLSEMAAQKYWPGELTLVLDKVDESISHLNINGKEVGVRVPRHEILDELFANIDFPLTATSANISGQPASTTFSEASEIGKSLDYLIDGGDCEIGIASTVADLRDPSEIVIHREGIITLSDFENLKDDTLVQSDWLKRFKKTYRVKGDEGPTL
jgi:L-threonylcarbamoyladenylate synthase